MGTRILAGELKGAEIPVPKGVLVRPLLAQTKKSLFDIIKNNIAGASFLDLFAGSGSVGLEALSRGAKKVVWVDRHPLCYRHLVELLEEFKRKNAPFFQGKVCEAFRADVLRGLPWLEERFDFIFSGAPYKDSEKIPLAFIRNLLEMIKKEKLLKPTGLFIAQHHKKEIFEILSDWDLARQERYGDTLLSFFKPV